MRSLPPVHLLDLHDAETFNARLLERFYAVYEGADNRRTHFFHNRFENLYIDRERIPEIGPLIDAAEKAAKEILQHPGPLRCGHWYNLMGPGHQTSLHTHEEEDELLSAVYYVVAPENSGDLLLEEEPVSIRVTPSPGLMVFFPPDLAHSVETNESGENRLSIAFNFGPV